MFTGIIKATGRIKKNEKQTSGGFHLEVAKPAGWRVRRGESISVSGICLTVVTSRQTLSFTYMPETAKRSTLGSLKTGDIVNLEQALRLSDRLDGHIVQGHVDTVGTISSVEKEGNSHILDITVRDREVCRWIAEKGSVALDGISLTVTGVRGATFTVKILPLTWDETNVHTRKLGSVVNIETDILAKYIDKMYANKK